MRERLEGIVASFTTDVAEFLNLLDNTRSVITGSIIQRILEGPSDWTVGNVNICTPIHTFDLLCDFLEHNYHAHLIHHDRPFDGATFDGPCVLGASERKVFRTLRADFEVIRSSSNAAVYPIAGSHGDFLFNAVSSRGLCIGNPWPTLYRIGRCASTVDSQSDIIGDLVRKWRDRGYTVIVPNDPRWRDRWSHGLCPSTLRYFGDGQCFSLRFGEETAPGDDAWDMKMEWTAGWVFGGDTCENGDCATNLFPAACSVLVPRSVYPL